MVGGAINAWESLPWACSSAPLTITVASTATATPTPHRACGGNDTFFVGGFAEVLEASFPWECGAGPIHIENALKARYGSLVRHTIVPHVRYLRQVQGVSYGAAALVVLFCTLTIAFAAVEDGGDLLLFFAWLALAGQVAAAIAALALRGWA
jgi:hypothetical protein